MSLCKFIGSIWWVNLRTESRAFLGNIEGNILCALDSQSNTSAQLVLVDIDASLRQEIPIDLVILASVGV